MKQHIYNAVHPDSILTFISMIHTLDVWKMQGFGNIKIIYLSRDK